MLQCVKVWRLTLLSNLVFRTSACIMSVHDLSSPNPDIRPPEKNDMCKLCQVCFLDYWEKICGVLWDKRKIDILVPWFGSKRYNYGTFADITVRNNCPFCSFIARLISTELVNERSKELLGNEQGHWYMARCGLWAKDGFQILSAQGDVLADIKAIRLPGQTLQDAWDFLHNINRYDIWTFPSYIDWMQRTRNGELIDTRRIRYWLQDCQKHPDPGFHNGSLGHEMCYKNENRKRSRFSLLLIDVGHYCLVSADSTNRYIALSYIWGHTPFLKTTTHNIARFREKGALSDADSVPAVIADAIQLTKSLGESYLWVDALCLVQNDKAAKYRGIKKMHAIFAQAYLTIVAASAKDARSCLPGVRGGTRLPLVSEAAGTEIQLTKAMARGDKEYTATRHQSRGWTFQEVLLSRRCLIITYDQVYFRCLSTLRCELNECTHENLSSVSRSILEGQFRLYRDYQPMQPKVGREDTKMSAATGQNNGSTLDPYINLYANLVESYTHRQLTFESDILNAFAALQATLSKQMKANFSFGMPLANLGKALLWTAKHQGAARRRNDNGLVLDSLNTTLPSWSWISWKSQVQWTWPIMPYSYFVSYYITQNWSFVELVDTRCIAVSEGPWPHEDHETQSDTSVAVRLHYSQGLLCFTAQSVSSRCFLYRHATVDQTVAHLPGHNTEIVPRCTQNGRKEEGAPPFSYEMVHGDYDGLGRGIIFSLDWLQVMDKDQSLEFIALSYNRSLPGKNGKPPPIYYHFNGPTKEQNSHLPFLNCLLIKWHGDVAERVAYAQIGSVAWEAANPIMKKIVLG